MKRPLSRGAAENFLAEAGDPRRRQHRSVCPFTPMAANNFEHVLRWYPQSLKRREVPSLRDSGMLANRTLPPSHLFGIVHVGTSP